MHETLTYIARLLLTPRSTKTMEWHMLRLVNRDRHAHGLSRLRMQEDLRIVGRKHSRDMARQDYFAHENKSGHSPHDRNVLARVTDTVTGENLSKVRGHAHPTQHAETALMKSPGHRANILNPLYNCVGIGIVKSADETYYATQTFAQRALFFDRIPHKVSRKPLKLKGKTVVDIAAVAVRIKGTEAPILMTRNLKKQQGFNWHVTLPVGKKEFVLEVLTSTDGKSFSRSNEFTVKRRRFAW